MAKNSKFMMKLISLLLIGVVLSGATYFFTQQTFYSGEVWIPQFGELECAGSYQTFDPATVSWDGSSYVCGQNSYTPNGCSFSVNVKAYTTGVIKICQLNNDDCATFREWSGIPVSDSVDVKVAYGKRLYVNPDKYLTVFSPNQWTVQESSVVYKLRQRDSGFTTVGEDCSVATLNRAILAELKNEKTYQIIKDWKGESVLAPTQIVHYISYRTPAISDNIITRSDINSGQPIYIVTPGSYYTIVDGDDGRKYVETRNPQLDPRIECLPANKVYCDSEAKLKPKPGIDVECGQGVSPGYDFPQDGKWCRTQCVGDKEVPTTDCKTIPHSCPSTAPNLNPQTLTCEGINLPPTILTPTDWAKYIPWIVGGIFLIFLIIVISKVNSSNQQNPPVFKRR